MEGVSWRGWARSGGGPCTPRTHSSNNARKGQSTTQNWNYPSIPKRSPLSGEWSWSASVAERSFGLGGSAREGKQQTHRNASLGSARSLSRLAGRNQSIQLDSLTCSEQLLLLETFNPHLLNRTRVPAR